MEPEVFLVGDRGVGKIAKIGDAGLSTGNGCTKKKVSSSEGEIVLVVTWEREAERCRAQCVVRSM